MRLYIKHTQNYINKCLNIRGWKQDVSTGCKREKEAIEGSKQTIKREINTVLSVRNEFKETFFLFYFSVAAQ